MARGNRNRGKRDTDTATTQVDERGTAVEQAAAASVADDAPEAVSTVTDAVSTATATQINTARELDAQFAGQDLELSEEQQAELLPTPETDDADALFGVPSVDDLKNRKLGEDLLGTEGDPDAPPDDPRDALEASQAFNPFGTKGGAGTTAAGGGGDTSDTGGGGDPTTADTGGGGGNALAQTSAGSGGLGTDAVDAGIFDLIQDPGADGDPLSSFLGAVESKLGRDLGPAPSDQTNDPVGGAPSVAADPAPTDGEGDDDDSFFDFSFDVQTNLLLPLYQGLSTAALAASGGAALPIVMAGNAIVQHDVATDQAPNLVKDPGPDGEGAPLPEEFQRQLDSEVARLRALKPETGDGVTDPAESDVEVIDPSAALQTHAEQGRELFGQPDETAPSGSDANFNPGADPTGAGVITPSEDKDVTPGRTRNDDPFADAGTPAEPVTSSNAAPTDVESFLPSETTGTAIDDKPDVPDPISDPA